MPTAGQRLLQVAAIRKFGHRGDCFLFVIGKVSKTAITQEKCSVGPIPVIRIVAFNVRRVYITGGQSHLS